MPWSGSDWLVINHLPITNPSVSACHPEVGIYERGPCLPIILSLSPSKSGGEWEMKKEGETESGGDTQPKVTGWLPCPEPASCIASKRGEHSLQERALDIGVPAWGRHPGVQGGGEGEGSAPLRNLNRYFLVYLCSSEKGKSNNKFHFTFETPCDTTVMSLSTCTFFTYIYIYYFFLTRG